MDAETNARIADGIAAELRDIDANEPGYPADRRAFLAGCERGFRSLAKEKGGYPVEAEEPAADATEPGHVVVGSAFTEPQNAVVAGDLSPAGRPLQECHRAVVTLQPEGLTAATLSS